MTALLIATRIVAFATAAALAAIVAIGLLTGAIHTRGLLLVRSKGKMQPKISATRVQLLLVTIAGAAWYIQLVIQTPDLTRLPDPPAIWLAALGVSNALHLGGHTWPWPMVDTVLKALRRS